MKSIRFEIVHLIKGPRKSECWIAGIMDDGVDFSLTAFSTLGGITVKPIITQPRAVDKEGRPRFDLFVFFFQRRSDLHRFVEGQVVELVTEARAATNLEE